MNLIYIFIIAYPKIVQYADDLISKIGGPWCKIKVGREKKKREQLHKTVALEVTKCYNVDDKKT